MALNVTAAVNSGPVGPAHNVRFRSRRAGKVAAIPNTEGVTLSNEVQPQTRFSGLQAQ
jgi:hypothetical protein